MNRKNEMFECRRFLRIPMLLVGVMFSLNIFAAEPTISVTAQQRYPWNGKVDLAFTITGDSGTKYNTSFVAKDMVGGTNIAMKTICKSDGSSAALTNALNAGTYKWVWDAAADLPSGFVCDRVKVEGNTVAKQGLYMVIDLSGGSTATSYPVSYLDAVPSGGWTDTYKTTKLVLRRIEAGSFLMQGNKSVAITKPFYIAIFEMTVGQNKKVVGRAYTGYSNSGELTTWDRYADSQLSYNTIRGSSNGAKWPSSDAVDSSSIIGKLRSKTNLKVDLPTEAQWEYSCRAGTTTLYNDGSSDGTGIGYFDPRQGDPTIVGKYSPNAWGVYDMHGNVAERVLDWYGSITTDSAQDPVGPTTGSQRVCRGGSFDDCQDVYGGAVNTVPISNSGTKVCTSNSRVGKAPDLGRAYSPDYTSNCPWLGFRVVVNQ